MIELIPHPKAPLFSRPDGLLTFQQILQEMSSGNASLGNKEVQDIFRQAGFVNLWFFLKGIASHSGPFELLNEDLHMDMCNFRQSLLTPGCRGALFVPRDTFKTTIFTEGASAWELLRDPEMRIRITNQIAAKAEDFMHTVKNIFDSNELFAMLYPEYVPIPNQRRWNETEIVLPNRKRKRREASVESGGVGGASEGHHYDLHLIDDMIGLAALNSGHQSGAEMTHTRNWFWGSEKTLLQSMKTSRVLVVGTRYAVDDVYDDIIARASVNLGTPMRDFKPAETGKWQVYYRQAIENGESIFPENLTIEGLAEMAQDDYWTYVTQYLNDPQAAGLAEFNEYKVKKCFLESNTVEIAGGENILIWNIRYFKNGEEVLLPLSSCDLITAWDPAASERYMSAKTSRSAGGAIATDCDNNHFILDLRADYVKVTTMFNWMFSMKKKFKEYLRGTFLEAMGAFKVLLPIIREEETRRGENLNLRPVHVVGEKEARIRTILQPVLEQGRLFIDEHYYDLFWDEQRAFPQSQKKDILDMTSLGVKASIRPLSDAEKTEQRRAEKRLTGQRRGITGY
jgi:hypothetical protein